MDTMSGKEKDSKGNTALRGLRQKAFTTVFGTFLAVIVTIIAFIQSAAIISYNNKAVQTLHIATHMEALRLDKNGKTDNLPLFKDSYCILTFSETYTFQQIRFTEENKFITIDTAEKILERIKSSNKPEGVFHGYAYALPPPSENKAYTLYILDRQQNVADIRSSILVSILSLILFTLVAHVVSKTLARNMVRPAEEAFTKQKQFIADSSHELKTPLAAIKANAEILEGLVGFDDQNLRFIQDEIDTMSHLINDLLSLARLDEKDQSALLHDVDLKEVVESVALPLEALLSEKDQTLSMTLDSECRIKGNRKDLQKLVSILMDNGSRHAPRGGKMAITLEKKKHLILTVKNEGPEIPTAEREHLFERFYQKDNGQNRDNNFGLGLAIAKGVADEHHATLEIDCHDGWTYFIISFPLHTI